MMILKNETEEGNYFLTKRFSWQNDSIKRLQPLSHWGGNKFKQRHQRTEDKHWPARVVESSIMMLAHDPNTQEARQVMTK